MSNFWRDYRGFKISVNKAFESIENRIARGTAESKVVGYYFYVWRRSEGGEGFRRVREVPIVDYLTEAEEIAKAEEVVDNILKDSTEASQ